MHSILFETFDFLSAVHVLPKNICVDTEDLVLHVDDERGLLLPRHVQRLLALLGVDQ